MNQNTPTENQPSGKPRRRSVKEAKTVKPAGAEMSFLASLASQGNRQNIKSRKRSPSQKAPAAKSASPILAQLQSSLFGRVFSFLRARTAMPKQLRVAETVSLGEKRFVAIVHVEGRRFLIGGGSAGVSLLTQLDRTPKATKGIVLPDAVAELAG